MARIQHRQFLKCRSVGHATRTTAIRETKCRDKIGSPRRLYSYLLSFLPMKPRTRLAVLTVSIVLLLVAGCSGASPTTTTTTNTPLTYPDGLSSSGIQDAPTLADAHRSALENESFTREHHLEIVAANGTILVNETRTGMWDANRSMLLFQYHVETAPWGILGAPNGTVSYYGDGSTLTIHQVYAPGGVDTIHVVRDVNGKPIPPSEFWVSKNAALYQSLVAQYIAFQPGTVSNGSSAFVITSDSTEQSKFQFGAAKTPVTNVSDVSYSSRVAPSGVMQSSELHVSGEWRGTQVTVKESISFSKVGSTTVEAPTWYSESDG